MIGKITQTLAACGLLCLAIAGVMIAIGANLDNFWYNYQAEVLGNYAYGLLLASLVIGVVEHLLGMFSSRRRKSTSN